MRQLGYRFEREWQDALNRSYGWVWKVPDTRTFKNSPVSPKVPCDFLAVTKFGRTDYYECKQTSQASLPLRNISEHQIETLAMLSEWGARARFAINFNNRERGKKRHNVVYVVEASDLKTAIEEFGKERCSIPEDWFRYSSHEYKWEKVNGEYGWY